MQYCDISVYNVSYFSRFYLVCEIFFDFIMDFLHTSFTENIRSLIDACIFKLGLGTFINQNYEGNIHN